MPYSITEADGVLRISITGVNAPTELHAMLTDMEARVQGRASWPDNLLDMRGLEVVGLNFLEVMSIAKRREAATPPNPIRTAFIAESPALIGFIRMFQSLNQNPHITTQLFSTLEAAEAWLRDGKTAA